MIKQKKILIQLLLLFLIFNYFKNYDIENPATEERAKEERVKKFEKKSGYH